MELWFWAAVGGAVLSGIANFIIKIASHRNYEPSQFSFYGGAISVIILLPLVLWATDTLTRISWWAYVAALAAGCLGGFNNILKVKALQFIDTTIYYPLFKLVSPILAIVLGIILFDELFTRSEWIGLALGIVVPLLLIHHTERGRQKNLTMGLVIVLITGFIAAIASALGKYAATYAINVLSALMIMSVGILVGSLIANYYKGGKSEVIKLFNWHLDKTYTVLAMARGLLMTVAAGLILFAYYLGGELAIVHTINSLYILIPIVLSIIFYNEHWNIQKVLAIVLSIAALAFFH